MGIDIRLPLGLMFAVIGLLLWGYGVLGDKSIYSRSLGTNINLTWGAVLFFFGSAMLLLARFRRGKMPGNGSRDHKEGQHS